MKTLLALAFSGLFIVINGQPAQAATAVVENTKAANLLSVLANHLPLVHRGDSVWGSRLENVNCSSQNGMADVQAPNAGLDRIVCKSKSVGSFMPPVGDVFPAPRSLAENIDRALEGLGPDTYFTDCGIGDGNCVGFAYSVDCTTDLKLDLMGPGRFRCVIELP